MTSDDAQRKPTTSRLTREQKMGRSKTTNKPGYLAPPTPLRQTRRRRDLIRMFVAAIGPEAGDLALVSVRKAAELTVAAEAARARVLNGGTSEADRVCAADLDMLVKLEGEARRAIRALGLKPLDAKRVEAPPPPWSPLRSRITAATPKAVERTTDVPAGGVGPSGGDAP
jgi:hypothetical protein